MCERINCWTSSSFSLSISFLLHFTCKMSKGELTTSRVHWKSAPLGDAKLSPIAAIKAYISFRKMRVIRINCGWVLLIRSWVRSLKPPCVVSKLYMRLRFDLGTDMSNLHVHSTTAFGRWLLRFALSSCHLHALNTLTYPGDNSERNRMCMYFWSTVTYAHYTISCCRRIYIPTIIYLYKILFCIYPRILT